MINLDTRLAVRYLEKVFLIMNRLQQAEKRQGAVWINEPTLA